MQQRYNRLTGKTDEYAYFVGNVGGSTDLPQQYVWQKPSWAHMALITAISGGGGAGGGGGNGTTRGGGGSSSGVFVSMLVNANRLPEQLYISPGRSGIGGASNTDGTDASSLYITTGPTTSFPLGTCLLQMAGGGKGISGSTTGAGGSAPSTSLGSSGAMVYSIALYSAYSSVGAAGGNTANGSSRTFGSNSSYMIMGGPGGGGNGTFSGGAVNGPSDWPYSGSTTLVAGGAGGASSTDGKQGITTIFDDNELFWFSTSGSGGGGTSTNGRTGGRGGNGAFGSGGGGGGCGSGILGNGGVGGNGGAPLVMIQVW